MVFNIVFSGQPLVDHPSGLVSFNHLVNFVRDVPEHDLESNALAMFLYGRYGRHLL